MVSLEKSAYPYFNISENEVHPSAIELRETDPVTANEREKNYSLRFHMDNDAWDVIHKEVMDWRDSSGRLCTFQGMNALTLPSGWYRQRHRLDNNGTTTRLVSSLRQYSQWRHSPALGYQARNNSAVSL